MQTFQYATRTSDGSVIEFNSPADIDEYDRLVSRGIQPLALVHILFAKCITMPDGSRQKVFSTYTKNRFRELMREYPAEVIAAFTRDIVREFYAGIEMRNPIGLLIYRLTRHGGSLNAAL